MEVGYKKRWGVCFRWLLDGFLPPPVVVCKVLMRFPKNDASNKMGEGHWPEEGSRIPLFPFYNVFSIIFQQSFYLLSSQRNLGD